MLRSRPILMDQGAADGFLAQLRPEALKDACARGGVPLTLSMQLGYDHSYHFEARWVLRVSISPPNLPPFLSLVLRGGRHSPLSLPRSLPPPPSLTV